MIMSKKKIVVPKGMLEAALDGPGIESVKETRRLYVEACIEASMRWLSENPIVPSDDQRDEIICAWDKFGRLQEGSGDFFRWSLIEWQRRMFLAPEPDVPEAFKEAVIGILDQINQNALAPSNAVPQLHAALEAYRRGQKSR